MKNDPAPLLIQRELVDERKHIKNTAAGKAVNEELNALIKRHETEMNALREEMRLALEEKDEFMKNALEEETRKIKVQMDEMRKDSETLAAKYDEERKKMEKAMQRMQEQARQERVQAHEKHMKQIKELKSRPQKDSNASSDEREALLNKIHDLECKWDSRPSPSGRGRGCIII
jgi:hypothetical protein